MDVATWSEQIHFVVATGVTDKQKVVAAVGKLQEAIDEVDRDAERGAVPVVLPLQYVIRAVRARADKVAIVPPTFFTPAEPKSAEFREWIDSINEYQRFAEMKGKVKAEARRRLAKA